jgi:leader peptidase (prepilin peptidase)/N-methyltransferase
MSEPATTVLIALLGLSVGSFLNVCIFRLPRGESLAWPGSRCTSCGRALAWFENVPIVSWVVLGGRCRTCQTPISWLYPIVELLTAVTLVGTYQLYGLTALGGVRALFACSLIVLFVTDLQHKILPNVITLPGMVIGFVSSVFLPPGWFDSLIGIVVGAGTLFAISESYYRLRGQEGMGMGDVKLLGMIGAFLGWKLVLLTLVFASFAGSLVGVAYIVSRRGSLQYALPFGTFLAVGAFAAAIWGTPIVDWYLGFYG